MNRLSALLIVIFAVLIAVADGVFKAIAINRLPQIGSRHGFIDFIFYQNQGVAFDIPIPLWIVIPLTVIVCLWLTWIAYTHRSTHLAVSVSSVVVIIGALGNLIDRIINNFTTDYILLFGTSAINLSDVLVVAGIFALLWYTKDTKDVKSS